VLSPEGTSSITTALMVTGRVAQSQQLDKDYY